uniref:Uncharacterized protein n=1 Tax=Arundo donax TaxID=35708 RepID=A0A0A9DCJ4_ARUDO
MWRRGEETRQHHAMIISSRRSSPLMSIANCGHSISLTSLQQMSHLNIEA